MAYNPLKRPTAFQCLNHPYFKKFREAKDIFKHHRIISLEVKDSVLLGIEEYRKMLYRLDQSEVGRLPQIKLKPLEKQDTSKQTTEDTTPQGKNSNKNLYFLLGNKAKANSLKNKPTQTKFKIKRRVQANLKKVFKNPNNK